MNVLSRIKKKAILLAVNTVFAGTRFFGLKRYLLNSCEGIYVGQNSRVVAPIHIPCWSGLHIGQNCWIGRDFTLEGNGSVAIGDNCDLAPNVICVTGSHAVGSAERRAGEGFNGKIEIGNGSWIGTRALLLPNIVVGEGCVVGAASVVTKTLSPHGCYGGNPAKMIRCLRED